MDDVWGDILGPPHGTALAAVGANKTIKIVSFESTKTTLRAWAILRNPHQ